MSTGLSWEGLRQVCATLLGARHVPERLCGGLVYLGRYNKCSPLPLPNDLLCLVSFLDPISLLTFFFFSLGGLFKMPEVLYAV